VNQKELKARKIQNVLLSQFFVCVCKKTA